MATSQPIALPATTSQSPDAQMASGSFVAGTTFNPASYTRHFLGSPLSWRGAGSFGNRFYPGMSPMAQYDQTEGRTDRVSSSVESDRASTRNALRAMERADEHCRNYTCCGLNLTDLHALVEHFEECHVVVLDPYNPIPPSTYAAANYAAVAPQTQPAKVPVAASAAPPYQAGAFDPDDMELDQDSSPSSGSSTPPETPISTPVSSYPSLSLSQTEGTPAVSAFETRTLVWKKGSAPFATGGFPPAHPTGPLAGDGFNSYAGYAGYSSALPGAAAAPPAEDPTPLHTPTDSGPNSPFHSVTPAMLFSPSGTPSGSRHGSPTPLHSNAIASSSSLANALASTSTGGSISMPTTPTAPAPRASTTLSRPGTSLLLSKPFKCPKPNCNKSYKQANGLKYHIQHGSCNFAPAKEMEEVSAVLASRRGLENVAPQDAGAALESLSESELREVEREAERRLKPFACGIGECQRRYKNMNGLRYHYQHSGDHGAIGLALLASGQHECLRHGHKSARHHTPSSSAAHSSSSTPAPQPAPAAQQQQQLSQPQATQQAQYTGLSAYTPAMTQQAYAYLTQQQQQPYMTQSSAFTQSAGLGLGLNMGYTLSQ